MLKDSQRRAVWAKFAKYKVAQNVMKGYDPNWQYFATKKDADAYAKRFPFKKYIYVVREKVPMYRHDSGKLSAKKPSYEYSDAEKDYL